MRILNIAGYKFVRLDELDVLRADFLKHCQSLRLKGTILLSQEGININLAGDPENIAAFKAVLQNSHSFKDMTFRESHSAFQPFKRLKIKLKKEIITLKQSNIEPEEVRAPSITPTELKKWLDEERDVLLLDTRNDYEVQFGTFNRALNLKINHFVEFPEAVKTVEKQKPIVMFCTGGIRCEKAAIYMLNQGYQHVYQLEGGILDYFAKVGGDHYNGECYVFDERISLDSHLNATGTLQCSQCQGPFTKEEDTGAAKNICSKCGAKSDLQ